jgi:hypothetical protein
MCATYFFVIDVTVRSLMKEISRRLLVYIPAYEDSYRLSIFIDCVANNPFWYDMQSMTL